MRSAVVLLFGLCIAPRIAAQSPGAGDLAAARSGIDAGNAQYRAAFLAADADALSRVYDSAGTRLGEDGRVVRGRAAIADDVRTFLAKAGPVRVEIGTAQVWLVDEVAYETGTWAYTFQPKGRSERRIGGRYVTLWRRQPDGGWKIWADMGVPGT